MEQSPLTQQSRPTTFQPKVVELYQELFKGEGNIDQSEGFWRELFLLKPNTVELRRLLRDLSADDVLHRQTQTQALFIRAVTEIRRGSSPSDENALDTVTALLVVTLAKKFTNPSADIINVIAGLDQVDTVFAEFVYGLDVIIRHGRSLDLRGKAVKAGLSVASGAYKTSLLSYFMHRDLFPSIMKYIQDVEQASHVHEAFILLGILANYNKFEFQNPYRLRLDDFVNETLIRKMVGALGLMCVAARDAYVDVQDDSSPDEWWSLSNTLTYLGIWGGGRKNHNKKKHVVARRALDEETVKKLLADLPPHHSSAILLPTYDFIHANKLFCSTLVHMTSSSLSTSTSTSTNHQPPAPSQQKPAESESESEAEPPLTAFLSLTSYLVTHAHRSIRTSSYAHLNLLTIQILIQDVTLCKLFCTTPTNHHPAAIVRLCRQTTSSSSSSSSFLPSSSSSLNVMTKNKSPRPITTVIFDIALATINCNLQRRLDRELYLLAIRIITYLITFLFRARIRLVYHWPRLFQTLFTLVRFLTRYPPPNSFPPFSLSLEKSLIDLLGLCVAAANGGTPPGPGGAVGEDGFLPTQDHHDDLFYKLVEAADDLVRFRDVYKLSFPSITTLISIATYYKSLLLDPVPSSSSSSSTTIPATAPASTTTTTTIPLPKSPNQIIQIIKAGHESLNNHNHNHNLASSSSSSSSPAMMMSLLTTTMLNNNNNNNNIYSGLSISGNNTPRTGGNTTTTTTTSTPVDRYRESDHKSFLKRIARLVGDDVVLLLQQGGVLVGEGVGK